MPGSVSGDRLHDLGIAGGVVIGGWLSEYHGWRSIFYLSLPMAGFIFLAIGLSLRKGRRSKTRPSTSSARPRRWVSVGDGENDTALFAFTGCGVAVANAAAVVKAKSGDLTDLPFGAGVGELINRITLAEKVQVRRCHVG